MGINTIDSLLQTLEKSNLLDADQLARVRDLAPHASDARTLAKNLIALGLVTRWQSELLLAGRTSFLLGKYKLMELLGRGGMGNVYLARHTMMNRPVALKIISKQLGRDPANLERFFSEARAVAALNHPNIVHAYNIDNEGDRYYMVMEFVEGQDLQRMVEEHGPLDCALAAEYIRQAAEGLAHAHARNIIHCDIKPANLLVNSQGIVKILDMGMARLVSTEVGNEAGDEQVLGTVDYMAPELAMQSPHVDQRVDIYSLGCTLYFLLTAHPPFPEGSLAQRILKHQIEQPRPIPEQRAGVPRDLVEICHRMMAKKAEDRHQSADEVAARLAERQSTEDDLLLRDEPSAKAPEKPPAPKPQAAAPLAVQEMPDSLAKAEDPFGPGGLAFPDGALPPAEAVIPALPVSSKRTSKSRQPIIALVAGALAVAVLVAVVALLVGSPGSERRAAHGPAPQAATPNSVVPQKTPAQPESTAADKPSPQVSVPPPDQKDKPPDEAKKVKPPRKRSKRLQAAIAAIEAEKAAKAAAAASSPQAPADQKQPSPSPDGALPKAAAAAVPPLEAPPAGPLAGLPPLADLPLVGEQGQWHQPVTLGRIEIIPQADYQVELVGGDRVLSDGRLYVLERVTGPPPSSWVIRHETPVSGANTRLRSDVARLWHEQDAALMFQWFPDVRPEEANYLRNCILRIRIQNETRDLGLASPQSISPLTVNIDRNVSHLPFKLNWAPPVPNLKVELSKADGPQPQKLALAADGNKDSESTELEVVVTDAEGVKSPKLRLKPGAPVRFGEPLYLVYLRKDRTGRDEAGVVFKTVFQEKGGNYSAHLTLEQPEVKVFQYIRTYLSQRGADAAAEARKRVNADRAKLEKELAAMDTEVQREMSKPQLQRLAGQRQQLERRLRLEDLKLWYLDFYEAMQPKALVHFRVFIEIGDKGVVLASTEATQPGEPDQGDLVP